MNKRTRLIRKWLLFFMAALFLSGLTAMPLEKELSILSRCFPAGTWPHTWVTKVYTGIADTNNRYPFIAYGYDWLAFAHFVLAVLFIGPYKDPVRNKWVVVFGMIACILIIPFAFIAGHFRGIPVGWRLIDCSFGVIGLLPLGICYREITALEKAYSQQTQASFDNYHQ
jgi:hypothetical protein